MTNAHSRRLVQLINRRMCDMWWYLGWCSASIVVSYDFKTSFIFTHMNACMFVYVWCPDPVEPEVQRIVCCHVYSRNQTWVLCRSNRCSWPLSHPSSLHFKALFLCCSLSKSEVDKPIYSLWFSFFHLCVVRGGCQNDQVIKLFLKLFCTVIDFFTHNFVLDYVS